MRADVRRLLRSIPPVDELLAEDEGVALVARYSHASVRDALVIVLDRYRESIKSGETEVSFGDVEPGVIWTRVCDVLQEWFDPGPQKVINATGVVLHTNLGRAPLSAEAIRRLGVVGASYSDLEYDLKAGKRGSRGHFAVEALRRLTGAEDALVVNNNAAALLLILNTFAPGHGVVVSRGELVEIGGSFRIPEVLRAGGAHL
ncbi:MAG: L-seryl-tRNA(Sec) selenium transferase, partial [Bacillota bacterium]